MRMSLLKFLIDTVGPKPENMPLVLADLILESKSTCGTTLPFE